MAGLGHDLVILLGVRALLSLAGILCIVGGMWMAERAREAAATTNNGPQQQDYQDMEKQPQSEQQQQVATTVPVDPSTVNIGTNKVWQILEFTGFLLLALSFIFTKQAWFGTIKSNWVLVSISMFVLLVVAYVQVFLLRKYIVTRQVYSKRRIIQAFIVGGMVLVGILLSIKNSRVLPWAMPLGGLCIAIGPSIMWRCRKVGATYDIQGTFNDNPVLYNLGGPIYMFGWFWFWVGLNATNGNPDMWYMPIYLSHRTTIAYIGTVLIILSAWSTSYALDEAADKDDISDSNSSAFGVEGYFCGDKSEIRLVIIFSWLIFGLSPFLPYFSNMLPFCILLSAIGVGVVLSMVQERGLRSGDKEELKRWMLMADIMFGLFILLLCVQGIFPTIMSFTGAIMVNSGTYLLHKDRKRGESWMESKEVNHDPVVFSFGVPLFTVGMLTLGWAMSVPMGSF